MPTEEPSDTAETVSIYFSARLIENVSDFTTAT